MQKAVSARPGDIRNIVLVGAGGSGKTTLAEAMLHRCGAISRMGSVEQASTTSDHEPEARAHGHSTTATLLFGTYEGREVNFIDTPGHPEFVGAALAAMPAVETAVLVVDAASGVDHASRRLFHAAGDAGLARMVVVNRIDTNPSGLRGVVDQLKREFGARVHCLNLPTADGRDVVDCFDHESGAAGLFEVGAVHREILESAVEVDDGLLERYLGGERLDLAALRATFVKAMVAGHVVPVLFTSARQEVGVDDLLHVLAMEAPSPLEGRGRRLVKDGKLKEIPCDPERPLLAHVFKIATDAHQGAVAMLRLVQGRLDANTPYVTAADRKPRRPGHVLKVEGRDLPELDAVAFAGDLVALARMEELRVGDVLAAPDVEGAWSAAPVHYPQPMLSLALGTTKAGDDAKLAQALQRLSAEDPTFHAVLDPVTHELVASGLGDVHLRVMQERLKSRYRLDVVAKSPTVPYRETVTAKAEGHYRHKKQTGGAGQFAEVFLRVSPGRRDEGFVFRNEVFGGTIPTHFIPAVEKGVRDALEAGPLAGFPVHDVTVTVYDGKSHSVDSKDIAFRTAAKMATRLALAAGKPVLLEPIVTLEVAVPEAHVGFVSGELKHLRARVLGVTSEAGTSTVQAQAPLSELGDFGARLRGGTQGTGRFVLEPSHYEPLPHALQQKVVEARPARKADPE